MKKSELLKQLLKICYEVTKDRLDSKGVPIFYCITEAAKRSDYEEKALLYFIIKYSGYPVEKINGMTDGLCINDEDYQEACELIKSEKESFTEYFRRIKEKQVLRRIRYQEDKVFMFYDAFKPTAEERDDYYTGMRFLNSLLFEYRVYFDGMFSKFMSIDIYDETLDNVKLYIVDSSKAIRSSLTKLNVSGECINRIKAEISDEIKEIDPSELIFDHEKYKDYKPNYHVIGFYKNSEEYWNRVYSIKNRHDYSDEKTNIITEKKDAVFKILIDEGIDELKDYLFTTNEQVPLF